MWIYKKLHYPKAKWIENVKDTYNDNEPRMREDITTGEIINILKRPHKWKSPGIDIITKFWLHHLSLTHQLMTKLTSGIIKGTENIPDWLIEGVSYLQPKTKETTKTKKYRPIACLRTTCNMAISIEWIFKIHRM